MLAAILYGPNRLELTEIERPAIGDDEILARVLAAAICGTDFRIVSGKKTRGIHYPSIIGHELSGEVVEVGKKVLEFKPGDRIGIAPIVPCRKCLYCRIGLENVCANRQAIGYEFDGGFAEYVRIPAVALESGNVVHLPDSIDFEEAAILEPFACCINGQKKANVSAGDTVLVIGAGPIGLMHLMLAKARGARKVVSSELFEGRRRLAAKLGADRVVDPAVESLIDVAKKETEMGFDVAIMAVGVKDLVSDVLKTVRKGGRVSLFAGFPEGDTSVIDPNVIHYNEIIVTGASSSTRQNFIEAMQMVEYGMVNLKQLISHRFSLREINKAFDVAKSAEGVKILIEP